jgi:replicative DNA helicase
MYQDQILYSILEGNATAFGEINMDNVHMVFTDKSNEDLYNVLFEFYLKNNKVPSASFLKDYFDLEKGSLASKAYKNLDSDTLTKSEDLIPLIKLQLHSVVKEKQLDLNKNHSVKLAMSSASEMKELQYKYQSDVSNLNGFLEDSSHKRGLMFGDQAINAYQKQYQDRKNSDRGYYICKTGFAAIDNVIGGVHSVDKFTILGYTNQGKSPLERQMAYNQLLQGMNIMFISLEMDYESIQTSFYALHANNYKVFGLNRPKITTKKIREATLTQEEEDFLFGEVAQDFNNNSEYGTLYILQPDSEFSMDDLIMEVNKVDQSVMPIDLLYVDYAVPLIKPSKNRSSFDREDYNAMHRRFRLFGLTFRKGEGLAIFDCAQANRSGFIDAIAKKNKDNMYSMAAIGDFNALEKDSTNIISILQTDDMIAEGIVQIQHLKSRESKLFPAFRPAFDGSCGWFRETISTGVSDDEVDSLILEIEL